MLSKIIEAIRSEKLSGWLFSNFHHRDPLADSILGLSPDSTNSRRWFYALKADGSALKIVHSVEVGILSSLPGEERRYASLAELKAILSAECRGSWACDYSVNLPVISYLDAGCVELLGSCGLECRGAEALIQRVNGLLDPAGIASHERSAALLGRIVADAWALVRRAYSGGDGITEGRIRNFIMAAFEREGLITDHPPIVASGRASSDPHYDFQGQGRTAAGGEIIQLDMWAKGSGKDDIYADISWIGVFGPAPSSEQEKTAADLFAARDTALALVREGLSSGDKLRGRDVDSGTRDFLFSRGYGAYLRHRTGHGIDRECHGSGVNLDSIEFPDGRFLLEGSCFSIEPGIYKEDFGMRTEIDVYIEGDKARVSGPEPQKRLLTCG
jgi:Xaa-Pro dipeptidase